MNVRFVSTVRRYGIWIFSEIDNSILAHSRPCHSNRVRFVVAALRASWRMSSWSGAVIIAIVNGCLLVRGPYLSDFAVQRDLQADLASGLRDRALCLNPPEGRTAEIRKHYLRWLCLIEHRAAQVEVHRRR